MDRNTYEPYLSWQFLGMRYSGSDIRADVQIPDLRKNDGSFIDHADPYAFYSELRPGTASVTWTSKDYRFHDKEWQKNGKDRKNKPVNIYEMHFGSWKCPEEGSGERWYTYREMRRPVLFLI